MWELGGTNHPQEHPLDKKLNSNHHQSPTTHKTNSIEPALQDLVALL